MSTTVAQATLPSAGTSNAADFQPETRNPQTAPGQLFDQSQQLQSGDQSELLDNGRATIQVPHSSSNTGQDLPPGGETGGNLLLWLPLVLGIGGAFLLYRRLRRPAARPVTEPIEVAVPTELAEEKPAPKPQPSPPQPKKPTPKKSKSRRKKRARR